MTCWITILYIRKNKIIPEDQLFVVSKKAADIGGIFFRIQELQLNLRKEIKYLFGIYFMD